MNFILPVLLIGLGLYLLRDHFFNRKKSEQTFDEYPNPNDTPSFANAIGKHDSGRDEFDFADEFPTRVKQRNWKHR